MDLTQVLIGHIMRFMGQNKEHDLTRGEFLKVALTVAGTAATLPYNVDGYLDQLMEVRPVLVEGVEVYGLDTKIDTPEKFKELRSYFDSQFDVKVRPVFGGVVPTESYRKREGFWGKNIRAMEVVVRRSDYDNDPLGGNFVKRMKVEMDLMNRLLENTEPKSGLSGKVARVVVVDDRFIYHPSGYTFATDIDHSEFIGGSESGDKFKMIPGEYMELWGVNADSAGNAEVYWKQGGGKFKEKYRLAGKSDAVTNLSDYSVSYYRIHELFHRLFGLPDEYVMTVRGNKNPGFRFENYETVNGHFVVPKLTPFISTLAVRVSNMGIRGHYDHPMGINLSQQKITEVLSLRPTSIQLNIKDAKNIKIFGLNMNGGYYRSQNEFNEQKKVDSTPSQVSSGNVLTMDQSLFASTRWHEPFTYKNGVLDNNGSDVQIIDTTYIIQAEVGGMAKELGLPVSVLVMSKLAGVDSAGYDIEFTNTTDMGEKTLFSEMINDRDVQNFVTQTPTYAKMKVPGTMFTMVWYQKPSTGMFSGQVVTDKPRP